MFGGQMFPQQCFLLHAKGLNSMAFSSLYVTITMYLPVYLRWRSSSHLNRVLTVLKSLSHFILRFFFNFAQLSFKFHCNVEVKITLEKINKTCSIYYFLNCTKYKSLHKNTVVLHCEILGANLLQQCIFSNVVSVIVLHVLNKNLPSSVFVGNSYYKSSINHWKALENYWESQWVGLK
jgi:hypothetical protein